RGGNQPGGDDRGDGFTRLLDRFEDSEEGDDRGGDREQADDHLGGDAERAFGADEGATEVVAEGIRDAAAEPGNLARRSHDFDAEDVVGGDAEREAVRPT